MYRANDEQNCRVLGYVCLDLYRCERKSAKNKVSIFSMLTGYADEYCKVVELVADIKTQYNRDSNDGNKHLSIQPCLLDHRRVIGLVRSFG